jgi:hypothetical protein
MAVGMFVQLVFLGPRGRAAQVELDRFFLDRSARARLSGRWVHERD